MNTRSCAAILVVAALTGVWPAALNAVTIEFFENQASLRGDERVGVTPSVSVDVPSCVQVGVLSLPCVADKSAGAESGASVLLFVTPGIFTPPGGIARAWLLESSGVGALISDEVQLRVFPGPAEDRLLVSFRSADPEDSLGPRPDGFIYARFVESGDPQDVSSVFFTTDSQGNQVPYPGPNLFSALPGNLKIMVKSDSPSDRGDIVPEPSSLFLLAFGLLVLAATGRGD